MSQCFGQQLRSSSDNGIGNALFKLGHEISQRTTTLPVPLSTGDCSAGVMFCQAALSLACSMVMLLILSADPSRANTNELGARAAPISSTTEDLDAFVRKGEIGAYIQTALNADEGVDDIFDVIDQSTAIEYFGFGFMSIFTTWMFGYFLNNMRKFLIFISK